jgi:hypothetical protein
MISDQVVIMTAQEFEHIKHVSRLDGYIAGVQDALTPETQRKCHAGRDGDCFWVLCGNEPVNGVYPHSSCPYIANMPAGEA